ncbi:hypothetical protein [Pseudonocardia sp. ICBG162]|uniref:hypothetical protein n=1 Tax=Pseudonocardia sp. ICBG162 TaxID=2846761 RepID=UPI001CF64879|nr:hypothetical protein [Pseudonocardia sp. ICBG162]
MQMMPWQPEWSSWVITPVVRATWFAIQLDYGNVQELITWVVAAGALMFAARAARAAQETNRLQNEQLSALRADQSKRDQKERSEQAESIAVWFGYALSEPMHPAYGRRARYAVVRVRNASQLPIYTTAIYVESPLDGVVSFNEPSVIPPAVEPSQYAIKDFHDIPQTNRAVPFATGIYFRDCQNQFWHRDCLGALHSLSESDFHAEIEEVAKRWGGPRRFPNADD